AKTSPDYTAIKVKQNAAWGAGEYAKVGVTLQITGEELAEALDLEFGSSVLDVAAGNGNATLAFARRFHDVTSTDYVASLLEAGKLRASAEGLSVDYQVADAENLPFEAQTFEAAVSTFGIMFTPNQKQSASELQRVVRSGGKIGMANWTPESFIGQLFKTIGQHVPPPAGVQSPALWGSREWIEQNFTAAGEITSFRLKNFMFRYQSAEHFLEYFRTFYGPMQKAFDALDDAGRLELQKDVISLARKFDVSIGDTLRIPSEYAEIVITKN
ncbi:MAG: class I SAM-dependent methyltransferase, partial [Pseudomonadota bacterium]